MSRIEAHFAAAAARTSADQSARAAFDGEQLFTAWSAGFVASMRRTAGALQVELPAEAAVAGEFAFDDTGDAHIVHRRLNVSLPGLSPGAAAAVVEAAQEICDFAQTIGDDVDVAIDLT